MLLTIEVTSIVENESICMSNPTLVAFPKENWEYYEKMFLLINCTVGYTEQEMKFSIKYFLSKCDQSRRKLLI